MKRFIYLFSALITLLLLSFDYKVGAASCNNVQADGSVVVEVPTLPAKGEYNIWARMQVPDNDNNRFYLEVNNEACYLVGGSNVNPGSWEWVSNVSEDLSGRIKFNFQDTSGNVLKLIGKDKGVKVDRLILVKNDCIPTGLGNNCQSTETPNASIQTAGAAEIPPVGGDDGVGGVVIPSATITQNISKIASVIYYSDGSPVPTDKDFGLDTTLLTNGIHRISMQITMTDGTVTNEATNLNVFNTESAFSPIIRFYRLNSSIIITISTIIGLLFLALTVFFIIKSILLKKRLMSFHGF